MKKVRILALAPTFYPVMGGAEKAIHKLYEHSPKDIHITLLCPGQKKDSTYGIDSVIRIGNLPKNRLLKFIFLQWKFYQFGRKESYDIVHAHYLFTSGPAALLLKKKKLIFTEHHFASGMDICASDENPPFVNYFASVFGKKATKIIDTGATQKEYIKSLGLQSHTIHLGGNCTVSTKSQKSILSEFKLQKPLVLSVARIVARKRFDILIDAAKKMPNVTYVIAGKGPLLESLRKKAPKNVHFLGFVTEEQLEKLRSVADLFVSCSEFEGAGIMYFESFAAKIPLLAKKNVASSEAIIPGKNGDLFESSKELVEKMTFYLKNKKKRNELSENGYKSYLTKYNWDIYRKKYFELFRKM